MRHQILICFALVATTMASLKVFGPEELRDQFDSEGKDSNSKFSDKSIPANYGNFGHIPYGQSIVSNFSNLRE